ncbi:CBS domain-containing protein [Halobiforma nitratireducens]|uniref:MaoC domain-containing protein dehydratase n=1 Tax=Halobiforma nitratireducens JCM 10879 TaxID=1227454 RepID=M0M592_9EURY|nr:CBS domain-containing protein [Halobiforma nitratireducens]EMA40558.1 MaoC domain-containing protein dehydratase [Halobiforma nitratireducens JCM 10879]
MNERIPVAEIMVTDVVTAETDASATDAARLLRDERVSSVVVTDDGDPVGIVTEGDVATRLCYREDFESLPLAEAMSTPLETISPDASIVETVDALREDEREHLPVVDETTGDPGTLVGIVTTTELSYYVPHLVHRRRRRDHERPRRQVRTDTQYERDDWEFEYRGEDESTVSVGDIARFSKELTGDDVEAFAEVTGDTNRVHLDDEYASQTRFGERIVHGVLANGVVSAALARLPGLTIYLSQESSFHAPLSVGERVTATCEICEALGGEKYRIETTVTDEDDTVVLEGDAVVLIDDVPSVPTTGEESAAAD